MVNFIIADALTKMQNAVMAGKRKVSVPKKNTVIYILGILKEEGFITDFKIGEENIDVELAFNEKGMPMARNFKTVSKPGQRIYVSYKDLVPVFNGRGIGIVSTSAGIMSSHKAKARKLGGEYICKIW